jgi:trigger factor
VKVIKEKEENRQVTLKIEMEPAEVEKYLELGYHHLVARANIPGFRKGKASRAILERFVGRQGLLQEALEHLIPEASAQAVKEQGLEAIGNPVIDIEKLEPVVFTAIVPLKPEVTLGDYNSVRVSPEPATVTEENIDNVIEQLRRQHTTWEPAEREVKLNDLVTLDVESTAEGKPFLNQKGVQYELVAGRPFPATGFAEQLVEMKIGETKEFNLQLPQDYPKADLVGKEAAFKVKLSEIKQPRVPELNDEFTSTVDAELKTVAALREKVAANLKERAEEKAKEDFEEKVMEAVVALSKAEFPPVLVENEADRLIEQQARWLQANGTAIDDYLKQVNKTGEQLREELKPLATRRVNRALVMDKVAEAEKVEASEDEITAELEKLMPAAETKAEEKQRFVESPEARSSMQQALVRRKTLERLTEIAKKPVIEIAK